MSPSFLTYTVNFIKKSLVLGVASAGVVSAANANIHQWVTGNEQTNSRLQVRIEDKRNSFDREYTRALQDRISFDLNSAKVVAYYNVNSPTESARAFINSCQTYLAASYRRGHTNIFFAPQWQYGIRKYSDNFTTWYDLPPRVASPSDIDENLCEYQFTPEIANYIRTNYPYFHQDEVKIRAKFGLVLSAANQLPAGIFSNIYTPAFDMTPNPVGNFRIEKPAKVNLASFEDRYSINDSDVFMYTGDRGSE